MGSLLNWLFYAQGYDPHGACYLWQPRLIALHLVSDLLIGVSYMAISLMLIYLVVTLRREIPFHWMALAFGVFIIACGFTHFMEVVTLWSPIYWFSGGVKAITAVASVTTAVIMPRVLPRVPQLVTAARLSTERQAELERLNADLERALDEQKKSEAARRESEQRFAAFMDHSPAVAYMKDARGRYLYVNAAYQHTFNLSPERIYGATDDAWFSPEVARLAQEHDRAVLTSGQPLEVLETAPAADGTDHSWMSYKFPVPTQEGDTLLGGISLDVTEGRQAEEELRRLNQDLARSNAELEQFTAVASHDLRSPLNTIGGYAQLLQMRYTGKLDGQDDEFLTFIMEAVKRMQELIDDLLTYARLGREATDPQPVDCAELVGRVVAELHDAMTASDAVVSYDGLPTVLGQPTQLGRVFQNLIANAITFHGETPPRVTVSALWQDTEWLFTVQDNGIGIDPTDAERIFIIFQRLHTREEYPGTGLGLAICKKIVEGHGGRIWVESQRGQSTRFLFTLPAEPAR